MSVVGDRSASADCTQQSFMKRSYEIDFQRINRAGCNSLQSILRHWLPDGRRVGNEWVARNPRRDDRTPGSFSVNLNTGKWADFATGDCGGDVVSLAAYLFNQTQTQAARNLARMLGIDHG